MKLILSKLNILIRVGAEPESERSRRSIWFSSAFALPGHSSVHRRRARPSRFKLTSPKTFHQGVCGLVVNKANLETYTGSLPPIIKLTEYQIEYSTKLSTKNKGGKMTASP